jgi:hypothetical protein
MKNRIILFFAKIGTRELSVRDVENLVQASALRDRDLVYAAWAGCYCGEGLAYVRGAKFWTCSAQLLGTARPEDQHEGVLPFHEYSVPAEGDPAAPGMTTRPGRAT